MHWPALIAGLLFYALNLLLRSRAYLAAYGANAVFPARPGDVLILGYAFTQDVFPKPPDFSKLRAFDLAFLAAHPGLTLFLITTLAVLSLVAFAAAVEQGEGVLAARAPGLGDPARRAPLPAPGRRAAARRVAGAVRLLSGSCSRRSASAAASTTCCWSSRSPRSPPSGR